MVAITHWTCIVSSCLFVGSIVLLLPIESVLLQCFSSLEVHWCFILWKCSMTLFIFIRIELFSLSFGGALHHCCLSDGSTLLHYYYSLEMQLCSYPFDVLFNCLYGKFSVALIHWNCIVTLFLFNRI